MDRTERRIAMAIGGLVASGFLLLLFVKMLVQLHPFAAWTLVIVFVMNVCVITYEMSRG